MRASQLLGLLLVASPAALLVALGPGCDFTNPDDFDAGPDAAIIRPDGGGDDAAADAANDQAVADGSSPACSPPCNANEYCFGIVRLAGNVIPDGGDAGDADAASDDAGDAGADAIAPPSGLSCRPLPAGCVGDPSCACLLDASAPECPPVGSLSCGTAGGPTVVCLEALP